MLCCTLWSLRGVATARLTALCHCRTVWFAVSLPQFSWLGFSWFESAELATGQWMAGKNVSLRLASGYPGSGLQFVRAAALLQCGALYDAMLWCSVGFLRHCAGACLCCSISHGGQRSTWRLPCVYLFLGHKLACPGLLLRARWYNMLLFLALIPC